MIQLLVHFTIFVIDLISNFNLFDFLLIAGKFSMGKEASKSIGMNFYYVTSLLFFILSQVIYLLHSVCEFLLCSLESIRQD